MKRCCSIIFNTIYKGGPKVHGPPTYVGLISDVELTRCSGILDELKDKPGIAIMADKGFTIKNMLKDLHIEPAFLQDRQQLAAKKVGEGRKIVTVRIHVEQRRADAFT